MNQIRLCQAILVGALLLLTASRSSAQALVPTRSARDNPGTSAWSQRPLAFEAHLGVGAPLGFAGLAADWSFLDFWSVGAGAGLNNRGLQLALSNRLRIVGSSTKALSLELSASRGDYKGKDYFTASVGDLASENGPDVGSYSLRVDPAYWFYVAPGYDSRIDESVVRLYGGLAILLNYSQRRCVVDGTNEELPCDEAPRTYGAEPPGVLLFAAFAAGFTL